MASTEEFSDNILVDLDEFGVVIGIEVLDPDAELPLTDLCRQLHIHKDDEPHLARLLPTLRYSLRFTPSFRKLFANRGENRSRTCSSCRF